MTFGTIIFMSCQVNILHLHFRAFSRHTVIHTCIHTLMVVAAVQGADMHIRSSLGFSILPKDTSTGRPGELNQRTSSNKTLALPLNHNHRYFT